MIVKGSAAAPRAAAAGFVPLFQGARPRTLGVSLSAVVLGVAAAGRVDWVRSLAAAVVALGLQVGVNYLNDYFDGVRGVDVPGRLGPPRLVASGLASPRIVATAGAVALGVAAAVGAALALTTSPWLLVVGAACLLGAVLYSGGPRPYASLGLGELAVLLFFGPVATCGTAYLEVGHIPHAAWWAAGITGSLAVAVLLLNNLRDIPTDTAAGKRTLAVRLGEAWTKRLFFVLLLAPPVLVAAAVALAAFPVRTLAALVIVPLLARVGWRVRHAGGAELVLPLVDLGAAQLLLAVLLALTLWPW